MGPRHLAFHLGHKQRSSPIDPEQLRWVVVPWLPNAKRNVGSPEHQTSREWRPECFTGCPESLSITRPAWRIVSGAQRVKHTLGGKAHCVRLDRVAPDPTVSHTDGGPALWLSFHLHDVKLAFQFFNSSFIVKLIWEILHSTSPSYRFRLDVPRKTPESVIVKRPICV